MKQFYLSGKLIKNKLLIYALNRINITYIEGEINNFGESMVLFLIFKKAKSFELYNTYRQEDYNKLIFM